MRFPRISLVNQLLLLPIVLCGIALYDQYAVGWSASTDTTAITDPSPLVQVTPVVNETTPVNEFTPATITRITKITEQTKAQAQQPHRDECMCVDCKCKTPATETANRKTIETGDQQCRLNADGTSSCAQAAGACSKSGGVRGSGPVRNFYRNGGLFRRGRLLGRCRGGC